MAVAAAAWRARSTRLPAGRILRPPRRTDTRRVHPRQQPACRLTPPHPTSPPADVLLDLGSMQELDWRVPQMVMPMAPQAGVMQQQAAVGHVPPPAPQ